MMKHLHSTDDEVMTWRVEKQDLKDHVGKFEADASQTQENVDHLDQYGHH